ncbi:MAG: hypothetical protein AAGB10_00915 [Pseudomonadota bacterium]
MARILSLLRQERKALISADFKAFTKTSEALASAVERLGRMPVEDPEEAREGMEQIRSAARRNQALIEASRRGLDAARRLDAEVRNARTRLSTYSGTGQAQNIAPQPSTTDRRT